MSNFNDEIFLGLWLSTNCGVENIKEFAGYNRKRGITNESVRNRILDSYSQFETFQVEQSYYNRLENFFSRNFVILSVYKKDKVSFLFKSKNWSDIIILQQRKEKSIYYNNLLAIPVTELFPVLSKDDSVITMPLQNIFELYGKTTPPVPLNIENMSEWEECLNMHIKIYDINDAGRINRKENNILPFVEQKYDQFISLVINDRSLKHSDIATYQLLANDKLITQNFRCSKTIGCFFTSDDKTMITRHESSCSITHKITSKQRCYGNPESMLEYGVKMGYIPPAAANFQQKYFACFDIETFDSEYIGTQVGSSTTLERFQKIISIAIGSNMPGTKPIFLIRKSSKPEAEQVLVNDFVQHLGELQKTYTSLLPPFLDEALEKLDYDLGEQKFSRNKTRTERLRMYLKEYKRLRIFSFNGSKYILIFSNLYELEELGNTIL